jgi:hypothetical protein
MAEKQVVVDAQRYQVRLVKFFCRGQVKWLDVVNLEVFPRTAHLANRLLLQVFAFDGLPMGGARGEQRLTPSAPKLCLLRRVYPPLVLGE